MTLSTYDELCNRFLPDGESTAPTCTTAKLLWLYERACNRHYGCGCTTWYEVMDAGGQPLSDFVAPKGLPCDLLFFFDVQQEVQEFGRWVLEYWSSHEDEFFRDVYDTPTAEGAIEHAVSWADVVQFDHELLRDLGDQLVAYLNWAPHLRLADACSAHRLGSTTLYFDLQHSHEPLVPQHGSEYFYDEADVTERGIIRRVFDVKLLDQVKSRVVDCNPFTRSCWLTGASLHRSP